MEFNQKDVKRAIRDFEKHINFLQTDEFKIYPTRVRELMEFISQNNVLNFIVGPYLSMDVDFKSIENVSHGSSWFHLQLPSDQDLQIAYVLQIMKRSSDGEFLIQDYAVNIFVKTKIKENIRLWNEQILFPCLENLVDKLHDLIEDEVEGKEKVEASSLQIINYGSITADHGNVAIGKNIDQSLASKKLSNVLIEKALEQGLIDHDQVEEVEAAADEIQNELEEKNTSKNNLQNLAKRMYDIGSKGLLSLTTNVITDPRWGQAVTGFLLNLI